MNEAFIYRLCFYERIVFALIIWSIPLIEISATTTELPGLMIVLFILCILFGFFLVFTPVKYLLQHKSIFKAGKIIWDQSNLGRSKRFNVPPVTPENFKKSSKRRWAAISSIFFACIGYTFYSFFYSRGYGIAGAYFSMIFLATSLQNLKFGNSSNN